MLCEVKKVYSVLKAYPDFDMLKLIDIAVNYNGLWQKEDIHRNMELEA